VRALLVAAHALGVVVMEVMRLRRQFQIRDCIVGRVFVAVVNLMARRNLSVMVLPDGAVKIPVATAEVDPVRRALSVRIAVVSDSLEQQHFTVWQQWRKVRHADSSVGGINLIVSQ